MSTDTIQRAMETLAGEVLRRAAGRLPRLYQRRGWIGRLLDQAMDDPQLKVDLFRLIDVLPVLDDPEVLERHVREYLLRPERDLPGLPRALARLSGPGGSTALLSRVIRRGLERFARGFIVAEEPEAALPRLRHLHDQGLAFTADLLGEAALSPAEADIYRDRYLELLQVLAGACAAWPAEPRVDGTGEFPAPRANVSLKVSALEPHLEPADPAGSVVRAMTRTLPLVLRARELGCSVHLDAEQWELHGITLDLLEELATHPALRSWPHLGITVQTYLLESRPQLQRLASLARSRGTPLGVRLVRGAYWDTEVVRARRDGLPPPVYTRKEDTDASYELCTGVLLDNFPWLTPAFASHNLRSLAHAAALARARGLSPDRLEFQTIHGMGEPQRDALRDLGFRMRVYTPLGRLAPGMAFLLRRLLESTSAQGWLRRAHREREPMATLLAPPAPSALTAPADTPRGLAAPFANCPRADLADDHVVAVYAEAIETARSELPVRVPPIVAGGERTAPHSQEHLCPSSTECIATRVSPADDATVDAAVASAGSAWEGWRSLPLRERAAVLERLADDLQQHRFELAARQVVEVGKPWREADADVAEAVDLCRFYARRALVELAPPVLLSVPGEQNRAWYEGRGPTAVIAPWNFPLAILTGMSAAALVAGNPVLLKPAEQSSAVGLDLYGAARRAGVPVDVIHLLPGGEAVGRRLVQHPDVATLAFTGSKAVGREILTAAAAAPPGRHMLKRVVCEMGGKNAVVVDSDADPDAAVAGILRSAFGYAGQKCSACSRVIVLRPIARDLLRRLVAAAAGLPIGPAWNPATRVGPVIDGEAHRRLTTLLDSPPGGAELVFRGDAPADGYFVGPSIFRVDDPDHPLMQEELFGPVLCVYVANDFDHALDVANRTEYALTGAVYSRLPSHLASAADRFRVGNLYLNRGCTGAVVGRQPFGGYRQSGFGLQAGGPGYLAQFVLGRCATEDTGRKGFIQEVQI